MSVYSHPILQLIIGSSIISFSAVFVRLTTTEPTIDGFYRMFLGGAGVLLWVMIRRIKIPMNKQAWFYAILGGALFGTDLVFWHHGIMQIGPGLATVLINLQVFVLAIIGLVIYGDKVNWRYFFALPLVGLGLYFLVIQSWGSKTAAYQSGIYQTLIAMICYSMFVISLRKSQQVKDGFAPLVTLMFTSFTGAIILGCVAYFKHESFIPNTGTDVFWLTTYALFGQILGWLFISRGLARTSISQAGLILLLQPALSMIWDVVFFHRVTTLTEIAGCIYLLSAIYFGSVGREP